MDFRLTPEQEALKAEFENFFREEMKKAPPLSAESIYDNDEAWEFHRYMARRLGERGWLSRPWPREYGGQAVPIMEQLLFSAAKAYYRAPGIDVQGVGMLAPTLLASGNEEQKRQHLPPIAHGEIMWCQGWSEPNAGSDLASLKTRAVRDGDYYIINGQKTWTSGAHRAQWCFMLARTDPEQPRHRGLSFFLVDMSTPGINVRPVKAMNGTHMFNEMYFDDVKVPKENMVGDENRGWYVSLMTMNFERSSIGFMAEAKRNLEELIEYCKETKRDGKRLSEQPLIRQLLTQLTIDVEVGLALSYKVAWLQQKGEAFIIPAAVTACSGKVYGSELGQRLAYAGSRILGLYGQVKSGSKWSPLKGRFESSYQECISLNMGGGTSEIQRNVIAMRGLELPR